MTASRILRLTPDEAWQLLQARPDVKLVDIRSTMEYLLVGHPLGALHVPWIEAPEWNPNPEFVSQVKRILLGGALRQAGDPDLAIILICRSGRRSQEAAHTLLEGGFDEVCYVQGGFEGELNSVRHRNETNGWRHAGLPWEQC